MKAFTLVPMLLTAGILIGCSTVTQITPTITCVNGTSLARSCIPSSSPAPVNTVTTSTATGTGATATTTTAITTATTATAVTTTTASNGGINLSLWELDEPIGSAPGKPTIISPTQLASGFADPYFTPDKQNGSITFTCPSTGITTADSTHPRSELREMTSSGAHAAWGFTGTATLDASVSVPSTGGKVAVGQIHTTTTAPAVMLFYEPSGAISLQINASPADATGVQHAITQITPGSTFTYEIQLLADHTLNVTVNGQKQSWTLSPAFQNALFFFKAGDYIQYASGQDAVVTFHSLSVTHQ